MGFLMLRLKCAFYFVGVKVTIRNLGWSVTDVSTHVLFSISHDCPYKILISFFTVPNQKSKEIIL